MAHTHEYDCIVCGSHFDSSEDLSRHNDEAHLKNATGMERPRAEPVADTRVADRELEHDRNPNQGFKDPRTDGSRTT